MQPVHQVQGVQILTTIFLEDEIVLLHHVSDASYGHGAMMAAPQGVRQTASWLFAGI